MIAVEYYLLPGELPEDIKQDMAISHLTGRKSSMRKLKGQKDIGYGLQPDPSAIPIWSIVHRPNFEAFEKLTEFVLAQEERIRQEIMAYLSEPDDGRLASVITALGLQPKEIKAQVTLTELIVRALPCSLDGLYVLARKVHFSKKPEAAVRQNIRNLIKRNEVVWDGELLCHVGDSVPQTRKSSAKPVSLRKVSQQRG